ncbi:MAG: DUF362 domain-containing protein, partial [Bacteroidales bacterium]|nr:DUF362 domain-containing protein [Bacteroidales bacterium]
MKKIKEKLASFFLRRCPKTGRIIGLRQDRILTRILFPLTGILAIIWFLVRVIPKPSRIAYPCQQAAAAIGGGFLAYLASVIASLAIYKGIKDKISTPLARFFITGAAMIITATIVIAGNNRQDFVPSLEPPEGRNNPVGEGNGIFPGRVVWTQDFDATSWDDKTGFWWEDTYTNQEVVDRMFSGSIQNLTGTGSDAEAWDALFRYNNRINGRGDRGYLKGEKITVKINMNAVHTVDVDWKNLGYPSPQMLNAMVRQLIEVVGVSGEDIIITDPSRFIGWQIYDKIRSNKSPEYQGVIFEEKSARDLPRYKTAEPDSSALIWFIMPDGTRYKMCFPQSYTEADYIINSTLVRPHRVFGITSVAKNHFGAVWDFDSAAFKPNTLHAFALWDYPTPNKLREPHSAPVLMGHKVTYGKTLIYIADGLYTSINQGGPLKKMSVFNDDWFSSILMSQDPVALESV